jgi:urea transport system substrate-binding protein
VYSSGVSALTRRRKAQMSKYRLMALFIVLLAVGPLASCAESDVESIRVGVLHSLTGTMAISESPVVDAILLAIDELNEAGGVLGRQIDPVVVDARSDPSYSAEEAERLILEEEAVAIFGCWTSACRKSVRPVVEEHNSLLFYPVQFEGLEESPNIAYLGATPNQQILPAVEWAFRNLGQRFFLIGSDYVFPRAANEIVKEHLARLGAEVAGEEYILLGSTDFEDVVGRIVDSTPEVILNTVNGDSNIAFFRALRQAGITSEQIPTLSFSIAEAELQGMALTDAVGDYAAWNYFQSLDTSTNQDFVSRFQSKYGDNRVTDDPIEAAYTGVHLWADAVAAAGTTDTDQVRGQLAGRRYSAPQGWIRVDSNNQHMWKYIRVGQIREDGQFNLVWKSNVDMRPEPFPSSRSQDEWQAFLDDLYLGWNESWVNPGETPQ